MSNERQVYWLAIDKNRGNCSYEELKYREVIAQGWPDLDNLGCLLRFVPTNRAAFDKVFEVIYDDSYSDGEVSEVGRIMWDLLRLRIGDLVVGIEGTTVRGICEVSADGVNSYSFDPGRSGQFNYAQTVSKGTRWVDWDEEKSGFTPTAPAQSVPGIRSLGTERSRVIEAWERFKPYQQNSV